MSIWFIAENAIATKLVDYVAAPGEIPVIIHTLVVPEFKRRS